MHQMFFKQSEVLFFYYDNLMHYSTLPSTFLLSTFLFKHDNLMHYSTLPYTFLPSTFHSKQIPSYVWKVPGGAIHGATHAKTGHVWQLEINYRASRIDFDGHFCGTCPSFIRFGVKNDRRLYTLCYYV